MWKRVVFQQGQPAQSYTKGLGLKHLAKYVVTRMLTCGQFAIVNFLSGFAR